MGRKAVLAAVLCLTGALGVAACGSPKAPDSGTDKASNQPMPHATFFEPETDWVELVKSDTFYYWQIPEEYADKAVILQPALGGMGEFSVQVNTLCFNIGNSSIPAVFPSRYKVTGTKIQISENEFVKVGDKFKYDNGSDKGNITLIGLHGSKKMPKKFINSPCFQGTEYAGDMVIFYNPLPK